MNGTPIYDIKPYLPFTDAHPEALGGFTEETRQLPPLEVVGMEKVASLLTEHQQDSLLQILASDPRPHYHKDTQRIYGLSYAGIDIKFQVSDNVLTIIDYE